MKASKRKTGGAYRRYKQYISRHAKEGKDRTKAKQQVAARKATYKGFTAVQSGVNNKIAIYDQYGQIVCHIHKDRPLTVKELQSEIKFIIGLRGPDAEIVLTGQHDRVEGITWKH